MARSNPGLLRALTAGVAAALVLAACGPGQPTGTQPAGGASATGQAGGTIYMLTHAEEFLTIDPQVIYTGEDLAFFGATLMRSLTTYVISPDPVEGTTLTPDMATDLGTANADATEWSFTLRDGLTWQDGSEVTCEDVKYGVSRTFATDVINGGPTYAISYLDIPTDDEGASQYKGPYTGEGQELFDEAVVCDGNTITFHLNKPIPDFNYTVTLGFSAVPEDADTGAEYADAPLSNGPYQIESYEKGVGGSLVLVRNPNWDQASDPFRKAYPDTWEVQFGLANKVIDERIMQSAGDDQFAICYCNVQPENLETVFADPETPNPQFEGRAISSYDPFALYLWINVNKVPNVQIRQAMAVALDREGYRLASGGAFAGDYADGVIKPNIGQDYAPTGWAEDLFGQPIPPEGDPEFARQLIAESGEEAPTLRYDYAQSDVADQLAAIVKQSLEAAGFTINPNPIESGQYYGIVFDPEKAGDFGFGGWGPDWPNASTIISPLFTQVGGWDLSQVDDPEYNELVDDALTTLDRAEQATKWQELNKLAMERVYVIPTIFNRAQFFSGTKVGPQPAFAWPAYGSWPYAELFVMP
jgi:peptide/nickel transport system substrate-binding protein